MSQSASRGRQVEIQATFRLAPATSSANTSSQAFGVGLQLNTAGGAYTRAFVNGSAATAANGTLNVTQVQARVYRCRMAWCRF